MVMIGGCPGAIRGITRIAVGPIVKIPEPACLSCYGRTGAASKNPVTDWKRSSSESTAMSVPAAITGPSAATRTQEKRTKN